MKVALCLSGMPRQIKESWPLIKKNLVDVYQPDIYTSFWNDCLEEDQQQPLLGKYKNTSLDEFKELVKPTAFTFTNYDDVVVNSLKNVNKERFHKFGMKEPISHRGIGAFYLIESANNLKKQGELIRGKYDVVIRSRSDLLTYNVPDLHNTKPNTIHMSIHNANGGINDTFWYSDSKTADKFCTPFSFIQDFDFRQLNSKYFPHEVVLRVIAQIHNIDFELNADNQITYKFSIKPWEDDKHIRDQLFLTKNGWIGHPGIRSLLG